MINSFNSRRRVRRLTTITLGSLVFAIGACGGDRVTGLTPEAIAKEYWSLNLNYRFANLATVAPHNTIQLLATPRILDGTSYTTTLKPTFSSTNQNVLSVDSTGLVTALRSGVEQVIASLTIGNLTHMDTIFIGVSEGVAPQVSHISVDLEPSWTNPIARGASLPYRITARDAAGDPVMSGAGAPLEVVAACASSDKRVARCIGMWSGIQYAMADRAGRSMLTFRGYVFGTPVSDSIELTVGHPMFAMINFAQVPITAGTGIAFSPDSVTLAPGGVFLIQNGSAEPIDVLFDDPSVVKESAGSYYYYYPPEGSGNIIGLPVKPEWGWDPKGGRRIDTPGTYRFRNPRTGATGVVVVKAQ